MTICRECGSENVQSKFWVEVNTEIVKEQTEGSCAEDNFCPDCEQHPETIEVNERKWRSLLDKSLADITADLESIGVAVYEDEPIEDLWLSYYDSVEAGDLVL